jgi:hypothetical protein
LILKDLLQTVNKTVFGADHHLHDVKNYEEFKQAVPIRDYELFKTYIQLIKEGKENILWI